MPGSDRSSSSTPAFAQFLPLSMLRIWAKRQDAWLSFQTLNGDRYLVGQRGYFVELPDGSLAAVSPRLAFPVVDRYPSVHLESVRTQAHVGAGVQFTYVPVTGPRTGRPRGIQVEHLVIDLEDELSWAEGLSAIERYVAIRIFESGLVPASELLSTIKSRGTHRSLSQQLMDRGLLNWEPLLAICLDIRFPSKLDPPSMRNIDLRREWELTGEILIALGKITRTHLEQALKIKREGSQALGEILTSMGACTSQDVEECLALQAQVRDTDHGEVALIGQLLVSQGVLAPDALDEALRTQKIGRRTLESILLQMGACRERDIQDFVEQNNWHRFQDEIDDIALGHWLVRTGAITQQQLDEAVRIQLRGRQVLGELLISLRMVDKAELDRLLTLQKDIRDTARSGLKTLGALLVRKGKVSQAAVDEALNLQSIGRQPIGCILVALNACSAQDVSVALDLQRKWRDKPHQLDDRLGEVLIKSGVLSLDQLDEFLPLHREQGLPLGRILIEHEVLSPEQIIDALLVRDRRRHQDFLNFLKDHGPQHWDRTTIAQRLASAMESSLFDKVGSWILKRVRKTTSEIPRQ